MIIAISVVAGVLALVLLLSVVQKLTLSAIEKTMQARVAERLAGKEILKSELTAMSFGQESKGKLQGRGNGALVLTTEEVVFLRAVMPTELFIPLAKVTNLSFVHSHLGKATPFKLLKIEFDSETGPDSIALILKDAVGFRDAVESARTRSAAA
jgi:hypothetical protein